MLRCHIELLCLLKFDHGEVLDEVTSQGKNIGNFGIEMKNYKSRIVENVCTKIHALSDSLQMIELAK